MDVNLDRAGGKGIFDRIFKGDSAKTFMMKGAKNLKWSC